MTDALLHQYGDLAHELRAGISLIRQTYRGQQELEALLLAIQLRAEVLAQACKMARLIDSLANARAPTQEQTDDNPSTSTNN